MSDYWFKRRRFGWGYTPVTWQGWTLLVVFVLMVAAPALALREDTGGGVAALYLLWVFALTALFVGVCIARGPRPRWRWGKKDTDDPDEDF